MLDGATIALLAAGLGVGLVAALVPVLPVEAYVLAVATTSGRPLAVAVAVAVAAGQTLGKLAVFWAVRGAAGSRWLVRPRRSTGPPVRPADRPAGESAGDPGDAGERPRPRWRDLLHRARERTARAGDATLAALAGPAGGPVVLLSATVGLPPLVAVAPVAGASPMRWTTFATACLLGRTARFTALAAAPQALGALVGA